MNLFKCVLGKNPCFIAGEYIKPTGIMVHSTGANNPMLRRYVQPMVGYADYDELMEKLGDNPNNNDWNNTTRQVCVHAFVGKLADGSIASVQTLPWDMRGWHSGTGKKGSANDTHISFEICEDNLKDPLYFSSVYKEAVELTAHLCGLYGLNPLADGVVICHSEGYQRGIANNHGDVMHWFPKHGKSMDTFRADVSALLVKPDDGSEWSKEARTWAVETGLIVGTGNGYEWKRPVTREEMVTILHRYSKMK